MRMNNDDTRFNPQIAALAMPQESGFKAAADGIVNVGKVFLDAEERQQTSALNALKMDGAREDLKAKQFENSIAGEKWDQTKTTYALDRRNKTLEGMKSQLDYDAKVKTAQDSKFMDEFKKLVPASTFNDPKTGRFSEDLYKSKRSEYMGANDWASENIHFLDALADTYRKDDLERYKTKAAIGKDEALAEGYRIDNRFKPLKNEADIRQSNASAASSYASANKNNIEARFIPQKMSLDERRETRLQKDQDEQKQILQRMKETSGDNFGASIPGYKNLSEDDASAFKDYYNKYGEYPTVMKRTKKGWISDDEEYFLRYPQTPTKPAGTPKVSTPKQSATKQPQSKASAYWN